MNTLRNFYGSQSKEDIAVDVKKELTKSMGTFGHVIIQALVTDIEPALKVKQAMNEINAATRLRYIQISERVMGLVPHLIFT